MRLKYFLLGLVFGTQQQWFTLTNGCLKNDNEKGKDFPQTFPLFNAELVKKGNKLVHLALVTDVFCATLAECISPHHLLSFQWQKELSMGLARDRYAHSISRDWGQLELIDEL